MLQGDDFNLAVTHLVNALNDSQQTINIAGPVGDDQHIGRRVGCQVPLLWHQGTQNGHQLGRCNIVDLHHAGHHLVAPTRRAFTGGRDTVLLGIHIRHDLDDFSTWHGCKTVHLQDGEEDLVDLFTVHGPG